MTGRIRCSPHGPCRIRAVRRAEAVIRRYIRREGGKMVTSTHIFALTATDDRYLIEVSVNDPMWIGAAECLIALKRWEILRQGRLVSLPAVCRAANLPGVPIDGYSGSPLRMAMISNEPVIYSVGPDGDDDGGLKDAAFGRNPDGDFVFRLPRNPSR